jgi:excisionase family DNA binding protein
MEVSKTIKPEILAAATGILQPYCPGLSPTDLVQAITNHRSEKTKPDVLHPAVTYAEFARLAGISLPTVNRLIKRGDLPKIKIGLRSVRIPYVAVEALLNGTVREMNHGEI